jgi:hypothetical protein
LLRSQLGLLRRLLRGQFSLMGYLGGTRCFSGAMRFSHFGGLSLFVGAPALFFNGFLHALAGFLPGLRARSREIPVLGAMQIGPGIESRHILGSLVRVTQRFAICHLSPCTFCCRSRFPKLPLALISLTSAEYRVSLLQTEGILTKNPSRTLFPEQ